MWGGLDGLDAREHKGRPFEKQSKEIERRRRPPVRGEGKPPLGAAYDKTLAAKATENNNSCIFYIFPFFMVSKIFERLLSSGRLMMENDGLAAHRRNHHNLGSAHWHLPVRLRVLPSWPLIKRGAAGSRCRAPLALSWPLSPCASHTSPHTDRHRQRIRRRDSGLC